MSAALVRADRSGRPGAACVLAWRTLPIEWENEQAKFIDAHGALLKGPSRRQTEEMLWQREHDARPARCFDLVSDGRQGCIG